MVHVSFVTFTFTLSFFTWNRDKIRPKSPVATRYGYVNVNDMKAMANLASFLTLEPDVVSKEMKVCPRPLASLLLTWFLSAHVNFAFCIRKTVGWIATRVRTGYDRIVRPQQVYESNAVGTLASPFRHLGSDILELCSHIDLNRVCTLDLSSLLHFRLTLGSSWTRVLS